MLTRETSMRHRRFLLGGSGPPCTPPPPGARDDAAAMQYLIPGWTFNPKRPALDR